MTEGPYYLDLTMVRSNIVENRTRAALALSLVVLDAATASPIEGAVVEIWHCDADGVYSGFQSARAGPNDGGTVYATTAPYSSRSDPDVRNDGDGIYGQGGSSSVLSVTKSGTGYTSTVNVGVKSAGA